MTQPPPGWPPPGQPPDQPPGQPSGHPQSGLNPPWRNAPPETRGSDVGAAIAGAVLPFVLVGLYFLTLALLSQLISTTSQFWIFVIIVAVIHGVVLVAALLGAFVPGIPRLLKSASYGALIAYALQILVGGCLAALVAACFALITSSSGT